MLLLFFFGHLQFFPIPLTEETFLVPLGNGKKELINKEKGVLRTVRKRKSGFGLVIESLLIHYFGINN